jgi:hypothetical protein
MNEEPLRPSRDRILTKKLFWAEVDILNIDDDATTLRSNLEKFGVKVNLYNTSVANGIVQVLGKNDSKAEYLIINAHGAEEDGVIRMPRLAPEMAAEQPFADKLTAEDLAKFVDVKDKVIITTACGGGHSKLADAFMKTGKAKAYIGDTLAPFGYVSDLFPTLIFYFMTRYFLDVKDAFERAKKCDVEEFGTWEIRTRTTTG